MRRMFPYVVAVILLIASQSLWAADDEPAFKMIMPPDPNPQRYDQFMQQLSTRLGPSFRTRRVGIFIIVSDITNEKQLDFFINHTLLKSASAMWNIYFDKKPDYPIYVYLLATIQSYNRFCRQYFGNNRGTPYGFYVAENRALVMNMQPGDGTLSHELTHALMACDMKNCPPWFSEGLGSLHEHAVIDPKELIGKPNWRHEELLDAIRKKQHTPLKQLMSSNGRDFHNQRNSLHYAEARYFCMYLQQQGKLAEYYKTYRDNFKDDPSGQKTLEKVTGKSVGEFEKNWIAWFLKLPPPK